MNFGTALAGFGQAQPTVQAMMDKQRQQQAQQQAFQALAQMAQKQKAPQALPGSTAAAPPGMPGAPSASGVGGAPAATTQAPPTPRGDTMAMIDQVANMDMPDSQRMLVLQSMGAFMAPIEKYTQQMDLQQTKLQAQLDLLEEKNKNLVRLQGMRDSTSMANTDKRVAATEANTAEKVRHDKTMEPIAQERADTNKSLATSRGALDAARVKALENKVPPENKKPFQAAKDTYDRAAALYQSLTRPGATPAASQEDVAFAKKKMDDAQSKMEALATGSAKPAAEAPVAKEKIKPGEEVRYDENGVPHVNRNGVAVPAEP